MFNLNQYCLPLIRSTNQNLQLCNISIGDDYYFICSCFNMYFQSLLFRVLCTAVRLHHPCGRLQIEEGSLAHNWDLWYKHLHSVLEIVCLEINYIQKTVKQNTVCDDFSLLAAITYYQVSILFYCF